MKVFTQDFAARARAHQTLRERQALAALNAPLISEAEHHRRTLRTEFAGALTLGVVFGFGGGILFALWLNVGGCVP